MEFENILSPVLRLLCTIIVPGRVAMKGLNLGSEKLCTKRKGCIGSVAAWHECSTEGNDPLPFPVPLLFSHPPPPRAIPFSSFFLLPLLWLQLFFFAPRTLKTCISARKARPFRAFLCVLSLPCWLSAMFSLTFALLHQLQMVEGFCKSKRWFLCRTWDSHGDISQGLLEKVGLFCWILSAFCRLWQARKNAFPIGHGHGVSVIKRTRSVHGRARSSREAQRALSLSLVISRHVSSLLWLPPSLVLPLLLQATSPLSYFSSDNLSFRFFKLSIPWAIPSLIYISPQLLFFLSRLSPELSLFLRVWLVRLLGRCCTWNILLYLAFAVHFRVTGPVLFLRGLQECPPRVSQTSIRLECLKGQSRQSVSKSVFKGCLTGCPTKSVAHECLRRSVL